MRWNQKVIKFLLWLQVNESVGLLKTEIKNLITVSLNQENSKATFSLLTNLWWLNFLSTP